MRIRSNLHQNNALLFFEVLKLLNFDSNAVLEDTDPGSGAFLTPGSGMDKNQDTDPGSGSGMNIPDHISRALKQYFWLKYRTQNL
jgi:hypothetical protein